MDLPKAIPQYLFLFAGNVQTLINFVLTLVVFSFFFFLGHITFSWHFVALAYLILTLLVFNIGVGMILSALFIFFRDAALRKLRFLRRIYPKLLRDSSLLLHA